MVFISFPVEEIIIPCSYCALHEQENLPPPRGPRATLRFFPASTEATAWTGPLYLQLQSNPVITTLVYMTPRLYSEMFCGTNYFITVNHNILLLSYNDTCS